MTERRYYVARLTGQIGPLTLDEIRHGLRTGRFRGTDLSWVDDGEAEWIALQERAECCAAGEVQSDHEAALDPEGPGSFVDPQPASIKPVEDAVLRPLPPELAHRMTPEQWVMAQRAGFAWRRFLARNVDGAVFGAVVLLILGVDPRKPEWPSLSLSLMLLALWPWFEALCISQFGTTPGKAWLRLRVVRLDGGRPHYVQALQRSVWVWAQGLAVGIPFLSQAAQIIAFNQYTRLDHTAWDTRAATRVQVLPISSLRMGLILALFVGSAVFSVLVLAGRS